MVYPRYARLTTIGNSSSRTVSSAVIFIPSSPRFPPRFR